MAEKYRLVVTPGCPYCEEAIKLLIKSRLQCEIIVHDSESPELKKLKEEMSWQTVPIVTLLSEDERGKGELFIGGCDDLKRHLNEDTTESEKKQEAENT